MRAWAAGSVCSAVFLLLFPVAVQQDYSAVFMTYKCREGCDTTGLVDEFACSDPKNLREIVMMGWSLKLHSDAPTPTLGNNTCTLKTEDLKLCDGFMSYFRERENNEAYYTTCKVFLAGRLRVFASPGIVTERFTSSPDVKTVNWTVLMGNMVSLICVPTCPANFSSNPGYIWYKDGAQLNACGTNSCSLTLNSIRFEDAGTYVCVSIGHEKNSSSAVNLAVQRALARAVSGKSPNGTSTSDQSFNYHRKSKSLYTLSVILLASVSVGLVAVMMVAFVMKKKKETGQKEKKKKKENKSCAHSVHRASSSSVNVYMSLHVPSQDAVYETLGSERCRPVAYSDHENSGQP